MNVYVCLLYTSDAADDSLRVDLGGRRIIKKKKSQHEHEPGGLRSPRAVGWGRCRVGHGVFKDVGPRDISRGEQPAAGAI